MSATEPVTAPRADPDEEQQPSDEPRDAGDRLRRALLAAVGVGFVIIGAIGAVVPGLPTTIFLFAASYCFARSHPALEQRLLRNRLFAASMRIVDGEEVMTTAQRAKISAVIALSVTISCLILDSRGALTPTLLATIVVAGLVGIVCVFRWKTG